MSIDQPILRKPHQGLSKYFSLISLFISMSYNDIQLIWTRSITFPKLMKTFYQCFLTIKVGELMSKYSNLKIQAPLRLISNYCFPLLLPQFAEECIKISQCIQIFVYAFGYGSLNIVNFITVSVKISCTLRQFNLMSTAGYQFYYYEGNFIMAL